MKIIDDIKLFLKFRRGIQHYQMIDVLEDADKVKLSAFDKDVVNKLYYKSLEKLSADMLAWNLSADYVSWAKATLFHFKEQFRKYNNKNIK